MTIGLTPRMQIKGKEPSFRRSMDFEFYDPGVLVDGDLTLRLEQTLLDTSGWEPLPTYRFRMVNGADSAEMGFINVRIGTGENLTRYRGHIGYGVDAQYRGRRYAARACLLVLPLARRHGLNPLWIACNPDNVASRRTCERIGARLVEVIIVPAGTEAYEAGAREKCRYRLDL